ncbi:MAG: hypothetical protein KDD35_11270 [Bdellovibrionales bacterium]|nr:hypothetical protein [Bdellovibrionales bacterium]
MTELTCVSTIESLKSCRAKGSLASKDSPFPEEGDYTEGETENTEVQPEDSDNNDGDMSESGDTDVSETDDKHCRGKSCRDNQSDVEEESDNPRGRDGFICVLDGPGKSVRLGLIDNVLSQNDQTPRTVCLSKFACEELVSEKFYVKAAEPRGYCPDKNPHVISLTDEQIVDLISKL